MKVCPCVFSQALVEKIVSPILCSSSACGTGKQKKKKRIVSPVETEVLVLLRLVSKKNSHVRPVAVVWVMLGRSPDGLGFVSWQAPFLNVHRAQASDVPCYSWHLDVGLIIKMASPEASRETQLILCFRILEGYSKNFG